MVFGLFQEMTSWRSVLPWEPKTIPETNFIHQATLLSLAIPKVSKNTDANLKLNSFCLSTTPTQLNIDAWCGC